MLIILDNRSRKDGLVYYLKNGTKGDRDKKDIRLTLKGDLEEMQSWIDYSNKYKKYAETYRNIVLSLEEDIEEIGEEKLKK